MRCILFLSLCFSFLLMSAQKNQEDLRLKSIKSYRERILNWVCEGDSVKYSRCKEKTDDFMALHKRYLARLDSVDVLLSAKNEKGGKYFYYLELGKARYFNWGDCETKVINSSTTQRISGCGGNEIDREMKICKVEKFNLHLFDDTGGQTFYREDINFPLSK